MKLLLTAIFLVAAVWAGVFYFVPAFAGDVPVAVSFEILGLTIHWYGAVMTAGILASFFAAQVLGAKQKLDLKNLENLVLIMAVAGLAGSRLYFVIFSWEYFQDHISEIFQIWRGGLSIYGGIIGGLAAGFLYVRRKSPDARIYLDLAAVVLPLGQAIGRFGNFFNQEAFGLPASISWKMFVDPDHRPAQHMAERFFHPTFLYESAWNLAVFFILTYIYLKQKPKPGFVLGAYFVLYGIGRFLIEGMRLDSFFISGVRVDQVASLVMIFLGTGIMYSAYEARVENH